MNTHTNKDTHSQTATPLITPESDGDRIRTCIERAAKPRVMVDRIDYVVVVPVYEPPQTLPDMIVDLETQGFYRFIVVDDGSGPAYQEIFESTELASTHIHISHHAENRGKGAAIKTAIEWVNALFPDAPGLVTVDGDGQHLACDVAHVCEVAAENPHAFVLGERDFKKPGVPARSRFGNAFSALFFQLDTGRKIPDTQTGLRVIPRYLYERAFKTEGERYEYEMNMLTQFVKAGIEAIEVPITTVYENNNAASHFDTVRDSIRIYANFLRFAASSATCAAIDLGLFTLITFALGTQTGFAIAAATVVARMLSGVTNFTINRNWSFKTMDRRGVQAIRYVILFLLIMVLSATFVTALSILPVPLPLVKVIVNSGLFAFSYFAQRNWVFKKGEGTQYETDRAQKASVYVGSRLHGDPHGVHGVRAAGHVRYNESGNNAAVR